MRTTLGTLGLGLAVLLAPAALRADDKLAESLVGTYTYESGKKGTMEIPEDRLDAQTVNITKETIALIGLDGKEAFVIKYNLKPGGSAEKCEVEMEITKSVFEDAVGSKAGGLIKKDGETVTVLYNVNSEDIPKDFEPEEGQHLFVLKRKAK